MASPRPSSTGEIARCISSTSFASRYWRIVAAPPPSLMSLPPAASHARSSASWMPPVTKMEDGAALHLDRRPRMMGEDEDRRAIGRLLAPPDLPALVGPGPAHRAEHVAAQYPGPDIVEAAHGEPVVDAGRALAFAVERLEGAGREHPLVQTLSAATERLLEALVGAGAEPVEREAEAVHAQTAHPVFLRSIPLCQLPEAMWHPAEWACSLSGFCGARAGFARQISTSFGASFSVPLFIAIRKAASIAS